MNEVCICNTHTRRWAVLYLENRIGMFPVFITLFIISRLFCMFVCVFYSGHMLLFKLEINNHKKLSPSKRKHRNLPAISLHKE